jgi:ParB family chromosome partitioning protein
MAEKKGDKKAKPGARPRARRKAAAAEPASRGLSPADVASGTPPAEVSELALAIERDGGRVLARWRDPLGGTWLVLAALPIDRVAATPFQRDLSEAHAERLRAVIEKIGRFLDPIIAVRDAASGRYLTPNGHHRLAALSRLGARAITALVVPDPQIAYRILALNTEKAHALRERALEVARMARDLAERTPERRESELALEFEEPALITVGLAYQKRPRFSGGAYHPVVRRADAFLEQPLGKALVVRERRADALLALDDRVSAVVATLRERGLASPYLRNFVLARINPLRFKRGATMEYDDLLAKLQASADKFDAGKVRPQDLAAAGGPPEEPAS